MGVNGPQWLSTIAVLDGSMPAIDVDVYSSIDNSRLSCSFAALCILRTGDAWLSHQCVNVRWITVQCDRIAMAVVVGIAI